MSATETAVQTERPLSQRQRSLNEWLAFFRKCWRTALADNAFEVEVGKLARQYPLSGPDVFEAWVRHIAIEKWVSSRMLRYLDILLDMGLLTEVAVLRAVMRRLGRAFANIGGSSGSSEAPNAEAGALDRMAATTLQRIATSNGKTRTPSVSLSMHLFKLIGAFTGAAESKTEVLTGSTLELGNAISNYLVAHVNDLSASGILAAAKGNPPEVLRKLFSKVVPRFIQILEASGSPCRDSLTLLQQQSKLQEDITESAESAAAALVDSVTFQQNVTDLPVFLGRASLIAFLSSLLTGRPKADDGNLRTFLTARYHDDIPAIVTDIIVASFHVLAAAIERGDNQEVMLVHKSFIANKLPLILEDYSTLLFGEKTISNYLADALKQVDENYKDTKVLLPRQEADPKQRLLLSSALVGLIQESQIPGLLGYNPTTSLPSAGRYIKDELVRQCQADSKRIEQLVSEMVGMEGNTGPIARALLELIHILSASRETMTLKTICNAFLRSPHTLNYMLLFTEPRLLLQPLCHLLDNWPTDDSSGEQHPVYDEFGSILLFLMVCQQRYDLPLSVFARDNPESFVLNFLRRGFLPKHSKDLDELEKQHLSGWIKGLFESNGISDETMSNCSPKDFYALVATLVDQSLIACQAGILGMETVKAGFEYLYEPWLLPSLLPVLNWFSSRLWGVQTDTTQLDHLMPVLTLIVKPPKLAPEAAAIHTLLLKTVALPLSRALTHVKNLHKRRPDVQPLLDTALKAVTRNPVTNTVPAATLERWLNGNAGGLQKMLTNSYEELMKLNSTGKEKMPKPVYDHRCIHHAVLMLGAYDALNILLQQAWKHLGNPKQQDFALDTLTGIIAANGTDAQDGRASLRDALETAVSEAHVLAREHQTRAQFLVRLGRRVEAHCAKPVDQGPVITAIDAAAAAVAVGEAAQQADLDATVVAAAVAEVSQNALAEPDLMAGIEEAVGAAADTSHMGQIDMGDMGADFSLNDFIQDYDTLGGQSVDDIFASL